MESMPPVLEALSMFGSQTALLYPKNIRTTTRS